LNRGPVPRKKYSWEDSDQLALDGYARFLSDAL
jgi:hypothetical protein